MQMATTTELPTTAHPTTSTATPTVTDHPPPTDPLAIINRLITPTYLKNNMYDEMDPLV